jgi:hypothetical protein
MEKEVHVSEVKAFKTKSGNARFALAGDEGNEYTTFREGIAAGACCRGQPGPDRVPREKLKPFKELVAEDIREGEEESPGDSRPGQSARGRSISRSPGLSKPNFA